MCLSHLRLSEAIFIRFVPTDTLLEEPTDSIRTDTTGARGRKVQRRRAHEIEARIDVGTFFESIFHATDGT